MNSEIATLMMKEYERMNAGHGGDYEMLLRGAQEIDRLRKELEVWKEIAWVGYRVINRNWEPTQYNDAYEEAVEKYGTW